MFKRRKKRSASESLREWVWPRSGWNRLIRYYSYRVARIPDSTYRVSAGLACGVAVSFTPFIGLHLLLSMAGAFLIRANVVASVFGTLVGNPWTFPFIWLFIYRIGAALTGAEAGLPLEELVDLNRIFGDPIGAFADAWVPMTIGGLIAGAVAWSATYFASRFLVDRYRKRREARLSARRKELSGLGGEKGV